MSAAAYPAARSADRANAVAAVIRAVAIALILFGIVVRFWHLDAKLFSYDEATTSIRAGGYTLAEYYRDAFDGRTQTAASYARYQHVDRTRGVSAAVRSLAMEDPQHPPLFYIAERAAAPLFGESVAGRRIVPALAGALAILAAVWLGAELGGSLLAGLVLGALNAVSPFFVIYSQQAREYSLWTLTIAVASALLLRAMRTGSRMCWIGYAVAAALGLYADLFFVYVLVAHAIYVAAVSVHDGARRRALAFVLAAAAAIAAFAPWLVAVVRGRALLTNNDYLSVPVPAKIFALKWLFNAGAVFFDLDYRVLALTALLVPIAIVVAFALVDLIRKQPVRIWAFAVALGAVCALALLVPDLARHESRSTVARYLVPVWLALEIVLALAIARWAGPARTPRMRTAAMATFIGVVCCGIVSVAAGLAAQTSWAEGKSIAGLGPIAARVNAAPDPLVVFVNDPQRFDFAMLALSNDLRPGVRVRLTTYGRPPAFAREPGLIYVLDPTPRVRAAIAATGRTLAPVYADSDAAPAALQALRAEAAHARALSGYDDTGLSLWQLGGTPHA